MDGWIAHVFSNEILFAFQNPPWSDAYCADLPSGFGRVVLQSVSDVTDHSCVMNAIDLLRNGHNRGETILLYTHQCSLHQ